VTELRTVRDANGIIVGDFNGDGVADIASFGNRRMYLHLQESDGNEWQLVPLTFEQTIEDAVSARCNNDALSDLVLVTDNPPELQVYLAKPDNQFYLKWKAPLTNSFEKIVAGDINSDGKTDLLLFGKKEAGITIFLGHGNGSFRPPTTILPDYTFRFVKIEDVDGDGINDILAINWVTNEVLLFSGYGRMKFSNPSTLSFESEPSMVATAMLDSSGTKDLVVGFDDADEIQTFSGSGFGGFSPLQTIRLSSPSQQFAIADFDTDGKQDIAVFSQKEKSVDVLLNTGTGLFKQHTLFSAGNSPEEFSLYEDASRSLPSLVVLDQGPSQLRMMRNSDVQVQGAKQMSYCTGLGPAGIKTSDATHDGLADILVANQTSQSISLFVNKGRGVFEGQVSFPCSYSVSFLPYCERIDSVVDLISTGEREDRVSVTEINTSDYSQITFALSTLQVPDILSIVMDRATGFLTINNLDHTELPRHISLMRFQQITQSRFIEQSLTMNPTSTAITASMGDYDGDGILDLAYLEFDKRMRKLDLYEAKGTASNEFIPARLAFSIGADDISAAYMWSADLNADGTADLIVLLGEPKHLLYTSLGQRAASFAPPHTDTSYAVDVLSKDRLRFFDMNGDGYLDVIVDNDLSKTIQVCFSSKDGTLSPPVRLINSEGLGGFAVDDVNNDGLPELIVTESARGLLRIISLEN